MNTRISNSSGTSEDHMIEHGGVVPLSCVRYGGTLESRTSASLTCPHIYDEDQANTQNEKESGQIQESLGKMNNSSADDVNENPEIENADRGQTVCVQLTFDLDLYEEGCTEAVSEYLIAHINLIAYVGLVYLVAQMCAAFLAFRLRHLAAKIGIIE